MARALVEIEAQTLRGTMAGIKVEITGKIKFSVGDVEHTLTARADRIDILQNGTLRLIDYKSGGIPSIKEVNSGFAPQLPLEAAIAARDGFKGLVSARTSEAYYVSVSGGGDDPASLEQRFEGQKIDFTMLPDLQFERLKGLLWKYLQPGTVYMPRHNLQLDDKATDYDHLSRRGEWELSGGGS
jgi:ATP-dependent helicase/nuclease subunit B